MSDPLTISVPMDLAPYDPEIKEFALVHGKVKLRAVPAGDGTAVVQDVPRWLMSQLVKQDEDTVKALHDHEPLADCKTELETANHRDLQVFLNARGVADHEFAPLVHPISQELRDVEKPPTAEKIASAAAALDDYYQKHSPWGRGAIRIIDAEILRKKALELLAYSEEPIKPEKVP